MELLSRPFGKGAFPLNEMKQCTFSLKEINIPVLEVLCHFLRLVCRGTWASASQDPAAATAFRKARANSEFSEKDTVHLQVTPCEFAISRFRDFAFCACGAVTRGPKTGCPPFWLLKNDKK